MEINVIKDIGEIKDWDDFLVNNPRGNHLMLSDWLKSYQAYGFDSEIVTLTEHGEILGGFGAVIAKSLMFRFYIVSCGPIVSPNNEEHLEKLVAYLIERAKIHKCCYAQALIPTVKDCQNTHVLGAFPKIEILSSAKRGSLFKYVYSPGGLNWVDFSGYNDPEALIMDFKPALRRNIRNSYRKGLEYRLITTPDEIHKCYDLFEQNSLQAGYSIRSWDSFGSTLLSLAQKGTAVFPAVFKDGEIKGALLLVRSGQYYSYIMGGSKKEKPDLRTGDLLQWEAIKLSFESGFDGYNITLGGSKGVEEFKNSFNTSQHYFDSKYYWELRPRTLKVFLAIENKIRPHKKTIAKMLSILKKR